MEDSVGKTNETTSSYKCDICAKEYAEKRNLLRHCKTKHPDEEVNENPSGNTAEPPEQGNVMVLVGADDDVDEEEAPFKCDTCGKGFTEQEALRRHCRKKHFKNPSSGNTEETNTALEQLEELEQQEMLSKPGITKGSYCEKCDKSYSDRSSLKRHNDSVHLMIRHTCDQCGKDFTEAYGLKRHIRTVHSKKDEVLNE